LAVAAARDATDAQVSHAVASSATSAAVNWLMPDLRSHPAASSRTPPRRREPNSPTNGWL